MVFFYSVRMNKSIRKGYSYMLKRLMVVFSSLLLATILSVFNTPESFLVSIVLDIVALLFLVEMLNLINKKKIEKYEVVKRCRERNNKEDKERSIKTGFLGVFAIPFFPDWTLETVLVFVLFLIGLWVAKEVFWGRD